VLISLRWGANQKAEARSQKSEARSQNSLQPEAVGYEGSLWFPNSFSDLIL
jgi:hypothetical protein